MVVSGCAVVVRFRATEAAPPALSETVLELKLQPAPLGRGLQLSVTLAGNEPSDGVRLTAYCAGKPAGTVAEGGLMDTVYPPAVNEAVAESLLFVSLALETIPVTEQDVQRPFGVTTKVTVARAPDCSVGI